MSQRIRQGQSRSRSIVISTIGAIALFLLAVTVFAVASQARSLSTQAERAVQTVENLRVVSLARVELSVASRINATAPEERVVIAGAIENSFAALESVEANFDETTSDEVRTAFINFQNAANDQAAAISQSAEDVDLQSEAELATGDAFTVLSEAMRAEQFAAIAGLEADNDLMNLIATVSTFIVAFVVPSAALFVFQALRTAPRDMRVLQLEYDRLDKRSKAMAKTISDEAAKLRQGLTTRPPAVSESQIRQSLAWFEHIAVANGAPTSLRNERIDVNEILASVIDAVDGSATVDFTSARNPLSYADPSGLATIAAELVTNALTHGEAPFEVKAVSANDQIELQFIDSGKGLSDTVIAVLHEQDFELREATLEGTHGYGLTAVRQVLEAMGGNLRYARHDDRTYMLASLPAAADPSLHEFPAAA